MSKDTAISSEGESLRLYGGKAVIEAVMAKGIIERAIAISISSRLQRAITSLTYRHAPIRCSPWWGRSELQSDRAGSCAPYAPRDECSPGPRSHISTKWHRLRQHCQRLVSGAAWESECRSRWLPNDFSLLTEVHPGASFKWIAAIIASTKLSASGFRALRLDDSLVLKGILAG